MQKRLIQYFVISGGLVLLLTAGAKLISASGHARALNALDPVFLISFRYVFSTVGLIEIGVASVCLFGKHLDQKVKFLTWISSCFLVYRFFLVKIGYREPCHCMGTLTDALHISPHVANIGMEFVLGYLLLGSYLSLIWLWRNPSPMPPQTHSTSEAPAGAE